MGRLKELFYRFVHEETGALCVGCGMSVDPITGILNVDLADTTPNDETSGLHCDQDAGLSLNINHGVNTCGLIHSGLGTSASPLVVNLDLGDSPSGLLCDNGLRVDRSEDNCNGIQVRANGLYAPCPMSEICSANLPPFPSGGSWTPIDLNTAGLHIFEATSNCQGWASCDGCNATVSHGNQIVYCNNSTCCQVAGYIEVIGYGGAIFMDAGFDAVVDMTLSVNDSGYGSSPPARIRTTNDGAVPRYFDLGNFICKDFDVLNPTECHQVSAKFSINVAAGTGTWVTEPNFEFYFHFNQVGCC